MHCHYLHTTTYFFQELAPMHSFKTLEDFIQNDEQEKIISFLQSRSCNVNDCDNDSGTTALMVASSLGKLEFVQVRNMPGL